MDLPKPGKRPVQSEAITRAAARGGTFGMTSAVLTTIGMMAGMLSGTGSQHAVLAGVITIAVADGMAEALSMHLSVESEDDKGLLQIWSATVSTFVIKAAVTFTFAVPVLLFSLVTAVAVSVLWGMGILFAVSWVMARKQGNSPWKAVGEHLFIAVCVVVCTWLTGIGVSSLH